MKAIVKNKTWESDEVFSLNLTLEEPLNSLPGQFVMLILPNKQPRSYSIVEEGDLILRLGIKVYGGVSKDISLLKVGDKVNIKGPFGNFIPKEAKKVVLVGGGIGVTPLISMYKYYKSKNVEVQVLLSSRGNFIFLNEFENPKLFDTSKGRRINADDINDDSTVFICGTIKMVNSLKKQLIEKGYDEKNIFTAGFG